MYVVVALGGDVVKLIGRWRKNYRYKHREVDWAVLAEKSLPNGSVAVFNDSLMGLFGALKLSEIAMGLGFETRIYWLDTFYSIETFLEEESKDYAFMGATGKDIERVVKGRLSSRLPETFSIVREDRVYGFGAYALSGKELKPAVTSWRSNVKTKLSKDMREHILIEVSRGRDFLVVFRGSFLSLLFISKLEKIFKRRVRATRFYKGTLIKDTESHIEKKLREKIEKIPPHLFYDIKRILIKRKLPRGKEREEIIEAMRY